MTTPPTPSIPLPSINLGPPSEATSIIMTAAVVTFWFALNLIWGIVDDARHRGELK